jgi:hypothetical protein
VRDTAEVVTLHPAAVERYLSDVDRLADLAAAHSDLAESAELVATLRRLLAEVIVHSEPNIRGFSVEVKGRLAEHTGSTAFPSRSEGVIVAGERVGQNSRQQASVYPRIIELGLWSQSLVDALG